MSIHLFPLRFRRKTVVGLLAGLAFLNGCGVDHERDAAELADRVYQQIAEDDFEGAAALYSESFYERVSRERWLDALRQVRNTLGRYEGHSVIEVWDHTFGPEEDPGEVFTVMMYRVTYAEGEAVEQLTFRRETPQVTLVNHQVMSERVEVNFNDADAPVQVASDSTGETPTAPDEQPETAPDGQEEPDETSLEVVQAEETPESPSGSLEEQIAAEVRRLRSATRDPETEQLLGQLVVTAIHPGRDRILVDTRLVEQGDPISREDSVILDAVESRRIYFRDASGAIYERPFLTSEP